MSKSNILFSTLAPRPSSPSNPNHNNSHNNAEAIRNVSRKPLRFAEIGLCPEHGSFGCLPIPFMSNQPDGESTVHDEGRHCLRCKKNDGNSNSNMRNNNNNNNNNNNAEAIRNVSRNVTKPACNQPDRKTPVRNECQHCRGRNKYDAKAQEIRRVFMFFAGGICGGLVTIVSAVVGYMFGIDRGVGNRLPSIAPANFCALVLSFFSLLWLAISVFLGSLRENLVGQTE